MRNGSPLCPTVAPAPAVCGGKKRAFTEDIRTNAEKPWVAGTSVRSVNPVIFELCQSMGKVMGVLPNHALTSAFEHLCVVFLDFANDFGWIRRTNGLYGSGKDITSDYKRFDVRFLQKHGYPVPGTSFMLSWTRNLWCGIESSLCSFHFQCLPLR